MLRAFRYALRARPAQERQLARWAGQLRWIWNQALKEQQARRERGEPCANYAAMCQWLTAWRNAPQTSWLATGPIHPQQQCLKRLDATFQKFFAKVKAGKRGRAAGYARFKRWGEEPGLRFPDAKQIELDAANGRVKLPKLGWVRLRLSRPVAGELRNVSVMREGAKWYASIQTQSGEVAPAASLVPTLGIDLGLTAFAGLSDGTLMRPLAALKAQACRLRRYQRSVSRKVKGSANRRKAVQRLARLYRKIAHQRSDWLHKLSTKLAGEHPVIAIEDLKVAAMSASARGTADRPGKRVKQKAALNTSILDAGWALFRKQLEYKCEAAGGAVVAVNPAYTSQTCSCCGHVDPANRRSQAQFECVACGHIQNADVNAAMNILAAGYAVWLAGRQARPADACGGAVRRGRCASAAHAAPSKQEPTEGSARA
jgi:putative transposase